MGDRPATGYSEPDDSGKLRVWQAKACGCGGMQRAGSWVPRTLLALPG